MVGKETGNDSSDAICSGLLVTRHIRFCRIACAPRGSHRHTRVASKKYGAGPRYWSRPSPFLLRRQPRPRIATPNQAEQSCRPTTGGAIWSRFDAGPSYRRPFVSPEAVRNDKPRHTPNKNHSMHTVESAGERKRSEKCAASMRPHAFPLRLSVARVTESPHPVFQAKNTAPGACRIVARRLGPSRSRDRRYRSRTTVGRSDSPWKNCQLNLERTALSHREYGCNAT